MIKIIRVKSCGECPWLYHSADNDNSFRCEESGFVVYPLDETLPDNCPLENDICTETLLALIKDYGNERSIRNWQAILNALNLPLDNKGD